MKYLHSCHGGMKIYGDIRGRVWNTFTEVTLAEVCGIVSLSHFQFVNVCATLSLFVSYCHYSVSVSSL